MRRLVLASLLAFSLLAPSAQAGTPPTDYSDIAVASGLSSPTALAFLPDGRMLVTEKGGALKLVSGGAATTLVNIPVCTASEMGLLGVAIDPNFATNGWIYLYRSAPPTGGDCTTSTGRFNQVVRVTMSGGTVSIGSLSVLLSGIRTDGGNHDAGTLRIGPDGKLWVSVGDSGIGDMGNPGDSTNPYSQDLGSLNGKILRLELSGAPAAGNPFASTPGARPEIYSYGFRNPFRFGFDPVTGKAWVGDVGQATREELDILQAGGDYSWPYCEGTLPVGCMHPGDVAPIFDYPRSGAGALGATVIGGAFAPASFGTQAGQYIFADFIASKLYSATPTAARDDIATPVDFVTNAEGPVDIVFGPDGNLYYVAINAGTVRQVAPSYPRPKGATPLSVPLVVAYRPCTSTNSTHGAPLSYGSCNPPAQQSSFLTSGTPDANGQQSNFTGISKFSVIPGDPATPADEADVRMIVMLTDVRRQSNLTDYPGQLQARVVLRITDKDNPPPSGTGSTGGTTQDSFFPFTVPCTPNTDPATGSSCAVTTSADAVSPGAIKEGMRAVWQFGQLVVLDGGPDDLASTNDNTVFARQGIFVP